MKNRLSNVINTTISDSSRNIQSNGVPNSRFCLTPMMFFLISTLLYFSPYAAGGAEVISESGNLFFLDYVPETGIVIAVALLCVSLGVFIYPTRPLNLTIDREPDIEANILLIATLFLLIYTAMTPSMYSADKSEIMDDMDRAHGFFLYICSISFVFSVITSPRRYIWLMLVSIISIMFATFVGFRNSLAFAVLGIAAIFLRNTSIFSIKFKYYISAIVGLIFLSLDKSIYSFIKAGQMFMVEEMLSPEKILDHS